MFKLLSAFVAYTLITRRFDAYAALVKDAEKRGGKEVSIIITGK